MNPTSEKAILRAAALSRRAACAAALPDHAMRIAGHTDALGLADGAVVGGYMALSGEADPSILMAHLAAKGHSLAVPRVAGKTMPLCFHRYAANQRLAPGSYGIAEPDADAPLLAPQVVLVPLLAFDGKGRRLGYGGGYYDRTLQALRAQGRVTAIGVAFLGQEVDALPSDPFDEPLDAVLTEEGLRRFTRSRE